MRLSSRERPEVEPWALDSEDWDGVRTRTAFAKDARTNAAERAMKTPAS